MKRLRGFTFVELMVVITIMVILISMAIPIYNRSIIRAKESVLKNNLYHPAHRDRQLHLRQGEGPAESAGPGHRRLPQKSPIDPMTGSNQTWRTIMEDASQSVSQSEPGIFDVKSGSDKMGLDGTAYSRSERRSATLILPTPSLMHDRLSCARGRERSCSGRAAAMSAIPLPPLANVPRGVTDLAAMQRGAPIIVQFTVPAKTTEGQPIPPPLRTRPARRHGRPVRGEPMGRRGPADSRARRELEAGGVPRPATRSRPPIGPAKRSSSACASWRGNGKQSGWSNFVVVPVVAPPAKPAGVAPRRLPQGCASPGRRRGTRLPRLPQGRRARDFAPVATVQKPEWTDAATEFGKPYAYIVQTIVKLDNDKEAESDLSDEALDHSARHLPARRPKGLQASSAPNSIELNWDRNTEDDLARLPGLSRRGRRSLREDGRRLRGAQLFGPQGGARQDLPLRDHRRSIRRATRVRRGRAPVDRSRCHSSWPKYTAIKWWYSSHTIN